MRAMNLLPWRETLRACKRRQFFTVFSMSVGATIFFLFLISCGLQYHIRQQLLNKVKLQQQFTQLVQQTQLIDNWQKQLQQLHYNLQVLDAMQRRSMQHATLFVQLAKIMPHNLRLTELYCVNDQLVMIGMADSNAEIMLLLQQLQSIKNIDQAKLNEIKDTQANQSYRLHFVIKARVTG